MSDFKQDLEFDNFMYRVHEVNSIVKKLASKDKTLNHMGTLEADKFLKDSGKKLPEDVNEDDIHVEIKTDKSVINHEAFKREDNPETMSQEQFMKQVEKDANQRFQDRQIKKEKCETLKTQAVKAFRRGEFEKALSCYNKALEYVKDSPMLYVDRAVTLLNLKLYDEAIINCETALQLNENLLKAWLLLSKAHYISENYVSFRNCIDEAKERNKSKCQFIEEFVEELTAKKSEQKNEVKNKPESENGVQNKSSDDIPRKGQEKITTNV